MVASGSSFTSQKEVDKNEPGISFTADNGSHIYLNGEQLRDGYTWDWRIGFDIPLDEIVLKAGKNVLAIAGWDSEEIAGINGNFRFSDDVEIGTSSEGWKVFNADWKQEPGIITGDTGLWSYSYYYNDSGEVVKPKYDDVHEFEGYNIIHPKCIRIFLVMRNNSRCYIKIKMAKSLRF